MKKTTRLLVVDDDPNMVRVCSEVLGMDGFEVRGAVTGREGLAKAREHLPDLALVDAGLPDLTGFEVCRAIKADPALSDTLVVLFSGSVLGTLDKVQGLEIGADDYLSKSTDWIEIRARLKTLLRLRDATLALRYSETHYRGLVEVLPDAVIMIDPPGRLTTANSQAVVMTGYSSQAELVGKTIFDFISPEDRERVRSDISTGLSVGIIRNREYTAVRKDGARHPVELRATVLKDAREQPFALVCVIRDISQRRQAEEQLRLLADAVQSTRDLIFITDSNDSIIFVNQAFQYAYGFRQDEISGRPVITLYSSSCRPDLRESIKRMTLQRGWRGEVPYLRKDGTEFIASLTTSAIVDSNGKVRNFVYVARDISERKRVQKDLEESQRRQKAILDNIADPAWLKDPAGKFLAGNEPLATLFRRPLVGIIGRTVFDFVPRKQAQRLTSIDNEVIRTGKPVTVDELMTLHGNRPRWFETLKSPIFDGLRQVVGTVGIARDITERKRAETLVQLQRDFGIFLAGSKDLKAASQKMVEIALSLEGIDCGWTHWVDAPSGALTLEAQEGLSNEFARFVSHFGSDSGPAKALKSIPSSARSSSSLWTAHRDRFYREGLLAVEVIPIRHENKIVAILSLGARDLAEIPLRSRLAVEATVAQVGGAIARIRSEELLRSSQELLQKAIHDLHAAVILFDADTLAIREYNPATTRIFGYNAEELIGRDIACLHVDNSSFLKFKAHLVVPKKGESTPGEFDFRMKRKSGIAFETIQNLSLVQSPSGRAESWVIVVHDITARILAEAELRQLPQRIIEAQEAEQLRVARDLHDSVNQVIASVRMRLRNVGERLVQTDPAAHEILSRCERLLVQAIEENRRIAHNLRPSDLDEFGLSVACRNFCDQLPQRSGLRVKRRLPRIGRRLPPAVELNLFRILQESINNIEKHAHAKTVKLQLSFNRKATVLTIQDDGKGFRLNSLALRRKKRRGIGLTNMQQRAASIGGTLTVQSERNRGTIITVIVPVEHEAGKH